MRESNPLAHSLGEFADAPRGEIGNAQEVERLGHTVGWAVYCRKAGEEHQIFSRGEGVVKPNVFGDIADASPYRHRIGQDVVPSHVCPSGAGPGKRGQKLDRRGLAGTIVAEETEDLAFCNRHGQRVQSHRRAIAAAEAVCRDCVCHGCLTW